MSVISRLPLSLRLAVRQLRAERLASALTAAALAVPSIGALVALIALRVDNGRTYINNDGTIVDEVPAFGGSVGFLLAIAPIATLVAVIIAAIVAAATLVRSRSQDHTLALLAIAGADTTLRFRIASARGILLGILAAIIAAIVGTAGGLLYAALFLPDRAEYGFPTIAAATTALASIPVAWVASVVPLAGPNQRSVLAELRGIPSPVARRWQRTRSGRLLVILGFACGLAALAVGLTGNAVLPDSPLSAFFLAAYSLAVPAVVLVIIGASLQAPTAFAAIEKALGRANSPRASAIRLAARDAATSPARTVPIIGTIMLVCFIFTAFTTFSRSSAETNVVDYPWSLQLNQSAVHLIDQNWSETSDVANPAPIDNIDEIKAIFDSTLDVDSRVLRGVKGPYYGQPIDDDKGMPGRMEIAFPARGLPTPRLATDGPCATGTLAGAMSPTQCARPEPWYFPLSDVDRTLWVGDVDDLTVILGHAPDTETRAAFERGDAIVFDARYVDGSSHLTLDWFGPQQFVPENEPGEFLPTGTPLRTKSVSATVAPLSHPIAFGALLSTETADDLGLVSEPSLLLAQLDSAPSESEQQQADDAIYSASDESVFPTFELGPSRPDPVWVFGALLIALGGSLAIAITAVGLARFENRGAIKTLTSLGAEPRIGSRVSGWYATLVVGYATVIGTVSAILLTLPSWPGLVNPFWPGPLLEVGVLAVGVPLIAAAIASALPDGRVSRTRR